MAPPRHPAEQERSEQIVSGTDGHRLPEILGKNLSTGRARMLLFDALFSPGYGFGGDR
jgi:hypothetical protein